MRIRGGMTFAAAVRSTPVPSILAVGHEASGFAIGDMMMVRGHVTGRLMPFRKDCTSP